ncbi:MAG: hypothetical protein KF915_20400 [Polyangiaceae bacterium]|nr:hypothetical protein [Polyangiaceae bacterium]
MRERAALTDLVMTELLPRAVVAGSPLFVRGSFPEVAEALRIELVGELGGAPVSLDIALTRGDGGLHGEWPAGAPLGAGTLTAQVFGVDAVDARAHRSPPLAVTVTSVDQLSPQIQEAPSGVAYVNDALVIAGDGFLLGGAEGESFAVLTGCFAREGAACEPIAEQALRAAPVTAFQRDRAAFPLAPRVVGIHPGRFTGQLTVQNRGRVRTTEQGPVSLVLDVIGARVLGVGPLSASLGQRVTLSGGGFVGPSDDDPTAALTRVSLVGDFVARGGRAPVSFELIPEFMSGGSLRYVVNEEDELGALADLRTGQGSFEGTVTPIVSYGGDERVGEGSAVSLSLTPVSQVVYVKFLPSYVESLRHFGLRAVDREVRRRALSVVRELFLGVSLSLREEEPEDFALYTLVEVAGPDPNGLGLLGYDNSPGKDVGNLRLDDRIGGLNALTQENGDPGYGGVFVESLFGFSQHPGGFAQRLAAADPAFDHLFDPFRPDRGGAPVLATEGAPGPVTDLAACEGRAPRELQVACAVHALGSLIGDTLAHELGHALGLAQPEGAAFHHATDAPGRLMDSGDHRPFRERARLAGAAPVMFCTDSYAYLQRILPSGEPDPIPTRVSCD